MTELLLQLKKPNISVAKLTFVSLLDSVDKLEHPEKDLHESVESWEFPILIAYFVLFQEHQKQLESDDSFRYMQSIIE